jgi:outer membrane protein OmpA-like peptidoglycan-associated protein
VLKEYPSCNLQVFGYTDNRSDAAKNMELSKTRATIVKDYIVSKGITAGRIETIGLGDKQPVADNATEEGRAKNRRVVVTLKRKG